MLALFAGFWLATASAPCVMAADTCPVTPPPCHEPAGPSVDEPDFLSQACPPLAQLGCAVADENLIKKLSVSSSDAPPAAPVLAYRPPELGMSRPGLRSASDAVSLPAPPPNLRYARLLI